MARIFISHNSNDAKEASALKRWLTDNGWDDTFLDIDAKDGLSPGERWKDALRNAADRCEAVLCLISPTWLASPECKLEFRYAETLRKHIFLALIKPCNKQDLQPDWQWCPRVWNAQTGKPLIEPLHHENGVNSAQFSPDGTRVVTASRDNTARVWDARSLKALTEPMHHDDIVTSAQFSPGTFVNTIRGPGSVTIDQGQTTGIARTNSREKPNAGGNDHNTGRANRKRSARCQADHNACGSRTCCSGA
jgi:hypothetical protein